MQKIKSLRSKKGSVLVFSLIILSFMLISALSIAAVSVTERRSASTTEKSARSFQVADSGVEKLLQKIYKGNSSTPSALAIAAGGSCASGVITGTTASGTYKVSLYADVGGVDVQIACDDVAWRDKAVKLRSEGISGNTTRAVEVAVKVQPAAIPIGNNACHVVVPIGSSSWSCGSSEYVRRIAAGLFGNATYATRLAIECCSF